MAREKAWRVVKAAEEELKRGRDARAKVAVVGCIVVVVVFSFSFSGSLSVGKRGRERYGVEEMKMKGVEMVGLVAG